MPTVSVIIVNYRSWQKLDACLDSLRRDGAPDCSHEIIVVDNDSGNEAAFAERVQTYPEVHFIRNAGNLGFSHGCNRGAQAANGTYLLFLNPDTEVPAGTIDALAQAMIDDPALALLSTRRFKPNGKEERILSFFPSWPTINGLGRSLYKLAKRRDLKRRYDTTNEKAYPDWLTGSIVFLSRETYDNVGGWDERYFMYYEDVDLSKRIEQTGGKIAVLTNTRIIHNHGGSSRANPSSTALAKTELVASRHIYLDTHTCGANRTLMQSFLVLGVLLNQTLATTLLLLMPTHPRSKTARTLLASLTRYYRDALRNRSWRSPLHRRNVPNA